jgi:hypothetical protein
VPKDSAYMGLYEEYPVGIAGANHTNICKFDQLESQKYKPVGQAIVSMSEAAILARAPAINISSSPGIATYDVHDILRRLLEFGDFRRTAGRNIDLELGEISYLLDTARPLVESDPMLLDLEVPDSRSLVASLY